MLRSSHICFIETAQFNRFRCLGESWEILPLDGSDVARYVSFFLFSFHFSAAFDITNYRFQLRPPTLKCYLSLFLLLWMLLPCSEVRRSKMMGLKRQRRWRRILRYVIIFHAQQTCKAIARFYKCYMRRLFHK